MPRTIDHRDVFSYAEARRLAERERAIATSLLLRAVRRWIAARLHRPRVASLRGPGTPPLKPAIRLG